MRDDTIRTALVIGGLLLAGVAIWLLTGRTYLAVLALAALAAALWRFFLPVVFELGEEGVSQSFLGRQRRIPWRAIGRYEVCAAGVLLLPDEDRSMMAPFRGLYIAFGNRRDEILAHVRHHLDRPK